jgi:hypothetical protein
MESSLESSILREKRGISEDELSEEPSRKATTKLLGDLFPRNLLILHIFSFKTPKKNKID